MRRGEEREMEERRKGSMVLLLWLCEVERERDGQRVTETGEKVTERVMIEGGGIDCGEMAVRLRDTVRD